MTALCRLMTFGGCVKSLHRAGMRERITELKRLTTWFPSVSSWSGLPRRVVLGSSQVAMATIASRERDPKVTVAKPILGPETPLHVIRIGFSPSAMVQRHVANKLTSMAVTLNDHAAAIVNGTRFMNCRSGKSASC